MFTSTAIVLLAVPALSRVTYQLPLVVSSWLVTWILPLSLAVCLAYYLMSLPLRRQERARFFLDLLETGLKAGRSVEQTVVSIARSRDLSVGPRFHLVAAHLESGHHFIEALEKVPTYLPPQVTAVLKVGQEIGDVGRVIHGCRRLLRDGLGRMRGAINYQIVMLFVFNPIVLLTLPGLYARSLSTIAEIFSAFGRQASGGLRLLFDYAGLLYLGQWLVAGSLCVATLLYVGGPRLLGWLQAGFSPLSDRLLYLVPWRRKRLQRDFSTMLAILLEAEVPEHRALALAAESTANRVLIRRAEKVGWALQQGQPLTDAVQGLDDSGELRWRLTNALRAQGGFVRALTGWQEALDAKAFQQEQAAGHFLSTLLVLLNGALVALIAASILTAIHGTEAIIIGR